VRSSKLTYFKDANRPTGVYAFNDEYALALLAALMRRGIGVPHDVALVGTDDLPMSAYVWPTLTTIRFDGSDIGKRLVDILDTLHKGLSLLEELARPLVPELIVRESS
jgi:LacI family transcriptional regulator